MKKILVTGGTVFVSKFAANYFSQKKYDVYVLNRNTKKQLDGVHVICADRSDLKDQLKIYSFDAVIDVCGYNKQDVQNLLQGLNKADNYIFISSGAVYQETDNKSYKEEYPIGYNPHCGQYGMEKAEAEQYLRSQYPNAYILRPSYLYGPMQNIYREPFIFECALNKRKFYIPKDGKMMLQFFHVEDLCKLIEILLEEKPNDLVINAGNNDLVDINSYVEMCYRIVHTPLEKVYVTDDTYQGNYFCFGDYEYVLDTAKQSKYLSNTKDMEEGLGESFHWYLNHTNEVLRKNYISYIDEYLANH